MMPGGGHRDRPQIVGRRKLLAGMALVKLLNGKPFACKVTVKLNLTQGVVKIAEHPGQKMPVFTSVQQSQSIYRRGIKVQIERYGPDGSGMMVLKKCVYLLSHISQYKPGTFQALL